MAGDRVRSALGRAHRDRSGRRSPYFAIAAALPDSPRSTHRTAASWCGTVAGCPRRQDRVPLHFHGLVGHCRGPAVMTETPDAGQHPVNPPREELLAERLAAKPGPTGPARTSVVRALSALSRLDRACYQAVARLPASSSTRPCGGSRTSLTSQSLGSSSRPCWRCSVAAEVGVRPSPGSP